eukprot:508215-Amphidinium_carterae.1
MLCTTTLRNCCQALLDFDSYCNLAMLQERIAAILSQTARAVCLVACIVARQSALFVDPSLAGEEVPRVLSCVLLDEVEIEHKRFLGKQRLDWQSHLTASLGSLDGDLNRTTERSSTEAQRRSV